jgi:hypothetical protein
MSERISDREVDTVIGQVNTQARKYLETVKLSAEQRANLVARHIHPDRLTVDDVLTEAELCEAFWILVQRELGLAVTQLQMDPKWFKSVAWDLRHGFGHAEAIEFWPFEQWGTDPLTN